MSRFGRILFVMALGFAPLALGGCTHSYAYRDRGILAYERGDYPAAQSSFDRALKEDSTSWRSHYYLGMIALHNGEANTARNNLEQAWALVRDGVYESDEPQIDAMKVGRVDVVDGLSEAMYRQGNLPKLYGFLTKIVEDYGEVPDYLRLAGYLRKGGDPDAALLVYRKAKLVAGPEDARPYLAIAEFYDSVGQKDQALIALRQAYSITPNDKDLTNRIRQRGLVPGPTIALPIDR